MNKEHADLLITNAAEVISCDGPAEGLAGDAVRHLDPILNGAVAVRDGKIVEVGNTTELESRFHPKRIFQATKMIVAGCGCLARTRAASSVTEVPDALSSAPGPRDTES